MSTVLDSTVCRKAFCPQGQGYTGAPIEAADGTLFGLRYQGGRYDGAQGIVFQFSPTDAP